MLKFVAALIALTLAACGAEPQPSVSTRDCPLPSGLPAGNLLLFGEIHGSVEAPRLISEVACSLSKSKAVAIGLEVPSQDQALIDKYLESRGTKDDVDALTSSDFWQEGRDGRSSVATLLLIEDVRKLKNEGHAIDLFAFDDQPDTKLERNVAIANGIRRFHAANKGTQIIALMGNIHAMQAEILTDNGPLLPSGHLLADLDPISILISYPAGTTWACMPACGVQNLSPKGSKSGSAGFNEGAPMGGYSHSFSLSSITASPPVIQQGA